MGSDPSVPVLASPAVPYRLIVDNGCDVAALIDREAGRVLWVSPECTRVLGYRLADFAEADPWDFVHPQERYRIRERLQRAEPGVQLVRLKSRHGTYVWLEFRLVPVRDDSRNRYLVASGRDVTQRMEAEARAGQTAAYYRSLVESSPDGIMICRGLTIVFANPASAALVGCAEGAHALIGRCALDFVTPRFREAARKTMVHFDRQPHPLRFEQDVLRADGSVLRVDATASPIVFDEHACSHFIFRDITERVRQAQALRDNEAALRRSEEQLRKFAAGLIEAQEAERRRIAAELHDDLCQQLTALTQRIDLLRDGGGTEGFEELLEISRSVARRAHDLAYELHPSIVEHVGLVPAMQAHLKSVSGRGLNVNFEVGHGIPEPLPGPIALCVYRVMQEGLRNVMQHAGVDRATVSLSGSRQSLLLRVEDQGCGFDVNESTHAGCGLGLMAMSERARSVGGEVTVRSSPGTGTVVAMTIPLPAAAAQ